MEDKEFQSLENNEIIIDANEQIVKTQTNTNTSNAKDKKEKEIYPMEFITMLCAIASIVCSIFAHLFIVVNSMIMYQIFAWIGGLAIIGGICLYTLDCIKNQKISLDKPAILMLIALAFFIF